MLGGISDIWEQAKGVFYPKPKKVDFNVKIGKLEYPAGQLFETLKGIDAADLSDLFSPQELELFIQESTRALEQIVGVPPVRLVNLPHHNVEDEFVRRTRQKISLLGNDASYAQTLMESIAEPEFGHDLD